VAFVGQWGEYDNIMYSRPSISLRVEALSLWRLSLACKSQK